MTKTQVNKIINEYCEQNNVSKKEYSLYPLYIHLNGFSHSIGFINHKANKNIMEYNYNSVGYSHFKNNDCWCYKNDHQRNNKLK